MRLNKRKILDMKRLLFIKNGVENWSKLESLNKYELKFIKNQKYKCKLIRR